MKPREISVAPGSPYPLGATPVPGGINFAVHAAPRNRVELVLCHPNGTTRSTVELTYRTGTIWHGLIDASNARIGDLYGYRVHGDYDPARGQRANPAKFLIDPAARAVTGEPLADDAIFDGPESHDLDSMAVMPRSRIVDPEFDWAGDQRPQTPWTQTVILETHVKGHTMRHPGVRPRYRGTYLGLAEPEVLDDLVRLGVTAVELLPVQAFTSETFLHDKGLVNYWGYNPFAWSAPAQQYAVEDAVLEFRRMVRALHTRGLEVILDVVFNHTAEGNEWGPVLSLKGFDNAAYYWLQPSNAAHYENFTGCGNTARADTDAARTLMIDCLRWWVESMHVDGFRFDLGPSVGRHHDGYKPDARFFTELKAAPWAAGVKWIAEPWDVGPGGYRLGGFPSDWSEWNDRYRDTIRSYWIGEHYVLGAFAERLSGSADIFKHTGRSPRASINFVTAHDGFTLADLVSYNAKHNEANLENNRDGHADNRSSNCGVEGPTEDPRVNALRRRQRRNLLATLLLSQGVPMLVAGDEFGRTQLGNNNAYCQDNPISWLNWTLRDREEDEVIFVRRLLAMRRRHPELCRDVFLDGARAGNTAVDIQWRHPFGHEMRPADWNDPHAHAICVVYSDLTDGAAKLVMLFNAADVVVDFEMPSSPNGGWQLVADTAEPAAEGLRAGRRQVRPARSLAIYERLN
jgi:glycogen operon protein